MAEEVIEGLGISRGGQFLDGTLGGGGHVLAVLQANPEARVLAVDRDGVAIAEARRTLEAAGVAERAELVQARFSELAEVAKERGFLPCAGLLLDLGISSHHVDSAERGFSFDRDGPLDMRMDPTSGESVGELLARIDPPEFAGILREYGEVRDAGRIARSILRDGAPTTTAELGRRVDRAAPGAKGAKGLKPKVFQALRIVVNDELAELDSVLADLPAPLAMGGRIVVISYHSLEDRRVKRAIDALTGGCTCPPRLPVCVCSAQAILRAMPRRALKPSDQELRANPRSRSARLRVAERVGGAQ
jgi:16S rRNA (cytosine1402-N4)-methyltransferase